MDYDYADGEDVDYPYAGGEEDDYDYDSEELVFDDEKLTLEETVHHCLLPTTQDALRHIGKLLFWCMVLRFITAFSAGRAGRLVHLSSALIGCLVLHHFFSDLALWFVFHAAASYVALYVSWRWARRLTGPAVTAVSLLLVICCELWLVEPERWHTVRGAQMLVVMKAVSAALDLPAAAPPPGPLLYAGYLLHPGTAVFGPWLPLADYRAAVELKPAGLLSLRWLATSAGCLAVGLFFMSVSTCWLSLLVPDRLVLYSVWIVAYREALAFRCSHYFVSFVSQATATISGISGAIWATDGGLTVTRPTAIEVPRSLVEVVVNWNLPMHYWLKTYVFRVTRPSGAAAAVLCTYAASAVLHGLNFQLAAVLLSLGVYTYAEHRLRLQLSTALTLCVQARRCRQPCHQHALTLPARLLNLLLALLAAFHLAYLGVVFDGSSGSGYNWRHTVQKWAALRFASHWTAAATVLVTWVL